MKRLLLTTSVFVFFLLFMSCKKEETAPGNDSNPTINSWKTLAPMPTGRHHFGFVECNGLLYAIGGYNADALKKVEAYNSATNIWETKADMPTARGYLVVCVVSNKIYAIGGISGGDLNRITYENVTEEYDPAVDKWTVKSPPPISQAFNPVMGNQF